MKKLFLFVLLFFVSPSLFAEKKSLVLVYTNSLNGYLDYCTCKADPKGGLVKRGTALRQIRKDNERTALIAVDTGDFFPVYIAEQLPPFLIKALVSLSYDAVTFGDQDLDIGIPQFLDLSERLPFVNSNATFTTARPKDPIPSFRIIKKNGITAAILAIQSQSAYRYTREATRAGVTISSPEAAIESAAKQAAAYSPDIVILLSHSGFDEDLALAKRIKGVDIIVGGHSQTLVENPERTGSVYILQAGSNGSRIGICKIVIDGKKIRSVENSFILPDMHTPEDDPYIRYLIQEYHKAEE